MDATSMILLAKIVSDLLIVITMGLPKVDGLSEDEKKAIEAKAARPIAGADGLSADEAEHKSAGLFDAAFPDDDQRKQAVAILGEHGFQSRERDGHGALLHAARNRRLAESDRLRRIHFPGVGMERRLLFPAKIGGGPVIGLVGGHGEGDQSGITAAGGEAET